MSAVKIFSPLFGPGFNTLKPDTPSTNLITTTDLTVTMTAANIQGMFATPFNIIPAPTATQAVIVDEILVELVLTSTAFAGGGVVHFYYHGQTTEIMSATLAAASINAGVGTYVFQLLAATTAGGTVITNGVGVDITNLSGAFTTGTGTATIRPRYRTINL